MSRFIQKAAPYILLAGGVLFLVLGVMQLIQMKTYVKVPAVVSNIEITDSVDEDGYATQEQTFYVTYRVAGQTYEEPLSFTKTNLKKGDHITVLYNPNNPHEVTGASKAGAAIYFAVGSLFTLGGVAAVVSALKKRD